ncbi:MAG: hypothetical protein ACQEQV_11300, partial [Fibrobacterota bacterium]
LVRGKIEKEHTGEGEDSAIKCKIIAEKVLPLQEARRAIAKSVHVHVSTGGLEEEHLRGIKKVCSDYGGECALILHIHTQDGNVFKVRAKGMNVSASQKFFRALRGLDAVDTVSLSQMKY